MFVGFRDIDLDKFECFFNLRNDADGVLFEVNGIDCVLGIYEFLLTGNREVRLQEQRYTTGLDRLEEAGVPHTHAVVNHDDSEMGVARENHEGVFVR